MSTTWEYCLERLEVELTPEQLNTWIRPLHAVEVNSDLRLLAPNPFVRDTIETTYLDQIRNVIPRCESMVTNVTVHVGSRESLPHAGNGADETAPASRPDTSYHLHPANGLRAEFTFDKFVEGRSNQMALAASIQVASSRDTDNNPLLIYGSTGVGKTHLMHAIGNRMLEDDPGANIVYLHSEQFMSEMITALQHNKIGGFKKRYRSVDTLLVDDIQFFAGKERTQEEFFHTFNRLLDRESIVVLTSDRYPKEIHGLENRLKTRFGGGLPIAVEPPDLETRTAILMNKAATMGTEVPDNVAFFIAQRIPLNVRELEGALRRVIASANFMGRAITIELAKDVLADLIVAQQRAVSIENIQRTVAQFHNVRVIDLTSKKRSQSIVRPRHIAMALAKELTPHSLSEIGDAFGGRDHTSVLYACKKVEELRKQDVMFADDYTTLRRLLTS